MPDETIQKYFVLKQQYSYFSLLHEKCLYFETNGHLHNPKAALHLKAQMWKRKID